jgi:hypothetical protein
VSTKRKKKPGVSEPTTRKRRKATSESRGQAAETVVASTPPRKPSGKPSAYTPALGRAIAKMLSMGMSTVQSSSA